MDPRMRPDEPSLPGEPPTDHSHQLIPPQAGGYGPPAAPGWSDPAPVQGWPQPTPAAAPVGTGGAAPRRGLTRLSALVLTGALLTIVSLLVDWFYVREALHRHAQFVASFGSTDDISASLLGRLNTGVAVRDGIDLLVTVLTVLFLVAALRRRGWARTVLTVEMAFFLVADLTAALVVAGTLALLGASGIGHGVDLGTAYLLGAGSVALNVVLAILAVVCLVVLRSRATSEYVHDA